MMPLHTPPPDRPLVAENRKATKSSLRERNQRLVLQQVLSGLSASRAEIARSTGLTRAAVSEIVSGLIERRLLREIGQGAAAPAGGKPPMLLEVDADAQQIVCIDASSDPVRGGLVSLAGKIVQTDQSTRRGLRGDDVVTVIAELMHALRSRASGLVLALAVGTPGVVGGDGIVRQAANLDWKNRNLAAELAESLNEQVLVINDAQAAAIAEYARAPKPTSNIASVLVGSGIGAGIVLNGRLYRGETSSAGEIGHIRVGGNEMCSCGRVGCLETLASLPSLLRSVELHEFKTPSGDPDYARAFRMVNPETWEVAGNGLATALAALVAVLDISDIVLGGPITAAGPGYLNLVQRELEGQLLSNRALRPQVRYSRLGEDSVLMGVASYALHRQLGVGWTSSCLTPRWTPTPGLSAQHMLN